MIVEKKKKRKKREREKQKSTLIYTHVVATTPQDHSRPQCSRVWECARKLWENLRRRSQNLAFWASQRMLFDLTKTFCFFYIYFISIFLCCFGSRTDEIQLTALENFQVSKALVVAAEKIPLNVPNHRFETWSLHMLDSWLNIYLDFFMRRKVKPEWLVKINVSKFQ